MKVVEDATCTHCGCVCDDITLTVQGAKITEATNACVLGKSWFLSHRLTGDPACLIEGHPASVDDGIALAAKILADASYPVVYGLSDTTSEAQRVAVSIGDWIGGCVDTTTSIGHGPAGIAFQDVGEVTCTLGEIRNRGDFIVFWGSNPAESHPRFFARFSLTPTSMYLPRGPPTLLRSRGRAPDRDRPGSRSVHSESPRARISRPGLRALAKGIELDATVIETETGVPLATWQGLMDRMKQARYGVILFGMGVAMNRGKHLNSYALLSLGAT